jgi:hypothetical protein
MRRTTSQLLVDAALGKVTTLVDRRAPSVWTFALVNGSRLDASAVLDDGWLLLDAPFDTPVAASAARMWELLEWTAMLGGGVRLAFPPGAAGVRAYADVPLDADLDLGRRVHEVCGGFEQAKALVCDGIDLPGDGSGHTRAAVDAAALAEICRQTGWTVHERDAGALAIDLDVPGGFEAAGIVPRGDGCAAEVPLFDDTTAPADSCRHALALLLLRTCGVVRMVRAAGAPASGPFGARFEVPFAGVPTVAELSHALGALSVACRLAAREAAVLRHDRTIAEAYLHQWTQQQPNQQED